MASSSPLSLTVTLNFRNPKFLSPPHTLISPNLSHFSLPKPRHLSSTLRFPLKISSTASTRSPTLPPLTGSTRTPTQSPLTGSTRTLATLFSLALSLAKLLATRATVATAAVAPVLYSAGPAFFAALRDRPSGALNTPLTVVAAGMSKWLDIYSGVLMVRVLLSWFPNIPWDRQPLSAIRDLCDPYLNLFRNIIPPVFDTLDVSPLLAFAVLGTLGSILNSSRGY